MKKLPLLVGALVGLVVPLTAFAGDCVITVTRIPCPGREAICFSKCNGVATCDETKKVGTKEACEKEATRNCTVFRPGDTKAKVITAKFNDETVNDGKDFCSPAKPEYNYNTCQ